MKTPIQLPAKITQQSVAMLIHRMRTQKGYFSRANYGRSYGTHRPVQIPDIRQPLLVAAQGPLMTTNEDGAWSDPWLTQIYVSKFCNDNNLTGA